MMIKLDNKDCIAYYIKTSKFITESFTTRTPLQQVCSYMNWDTTFMLIQQGVQ
jgi:hypothetical protein